jgi:ribosomal protein S12 methylthiotransferase accessory factor
MKADRGTNSTRRASKDVLRFAPNFTAYVLPPDVVCLYSEDRKFFLHGELYCALASAIGEGGSSVDALVRKMERQFPTDKIQEAGDGREKPRRLPRAHSIDRRGGGGETR